jgi:hypothetical protein
LKKNRPARFLSSRRTTLFPVSSYKVRAIVSKFQDFRKPGIPNVRFLKKRLFPLPGTARELRNREAV